MLEANKWYTWGNGFYKYKVADDGKSLKLVCNTAGELPTLILLEHLKGATKYPEFHYV